MSELLILIEGHLVGRIRAGQGGRLSLEYERRWSGVPEGYSLCSLI